MTILQLIRWKSIDLAHAHGFRVVAVIAPPLAGVVLGLRGRLGAFTKNVVGSTINSLGVTLENTTAAESAIRDTDFAAETAAMTRNQILVQASTQALAMSNSAPQSVLSLMRG